jgi:hypothetical protein
MLHIEGDLSVKYVNIKAIAVFPLKQQQIDVY